MQKSIFEFFEFFDNPNWRKDSPVEQLRELLLFRLPAAQEDSYGDSVRKCKSRIVECLAERQKQAPSDAAPIFPRALSNVKDRSCVINPESWRASMMQAWQD